MARKVFTSFHYSNDNWRASQVRNMGKIEKNLKATPNRWEEVKRRGDHAIKAWIDANMVGRSCLIVLIGEKTAGRKWIEYEIQKARLDGKGILGIYIHNLKDRHGLKSLKGRNPFDNIYDGNIKMYG